ncbi:hypothetical protein ILUMI_05510 [Ignelater luminosus]|uniref:Uncharacterized protein n=1 Tax=Ignelater luminosus TaxID=2038154 RepID=A0A8K0GI20_IGNLU|nr:hypothetical protein ILUMI_05510 [Ignelater luminosus]
MCSKLYNYIFNGTPSNCVICAIGPILRFATFFGTFSGSYSCVHLNSDENTKVEFKNNSIAFAYSECLMLLVLAVIIQHFYLLFTEYIGQKLIVMELLADIFFFTGGLITLLYNALKRKTRIHELNAWMHILQTGYIYGVNTILDIKETRRIRVFGMINCLIIAIGLFFYTLYVFTRPFDGILSWTTIRRPIAVIAISVQVTTIIQFNVEAIFIESLFKNCHKLLKLQMIDHLDNLIKCSSRIKEFNVMLLLRKDQIETRMQMTRRLHGAIYKNCSYMTNSEDLLSFLFKYPISKLSAAEAAQVEMLITTLTIQKPVLRASDMFTVGTRLLASISGTVVTYVLVALQFHASWTEQ